MTTTELVRPRSRSGGLSRSASFWFVGALYALFLMASTAPSPMYSIYQQRWGFTTTVLTEVFAVYAVAILAALLLFGSLSDHIGRRPVLLVALVLEIVSMLLLAFAPAVGWLYAGRALQGLATGVATSAISGSLLDFQRPGSNHGSLLNGVAAAFGMALGSLLAGALVQYVPGPTLTSYLLLVLGLAVAIAGVLAMPEPVAQRSKLREVLRPQRPALPAGKGLAFALMATTLLASWIVGGMFMSLGPSVAKGLVEGSPYLIGGAAVAALAGFGGLSQLVLSGVDARRAVRIGGPVMVLGLAGVATSTVEHQPVVFFTAAAVLGAGWGVMFMGGMRMLTGLASPEHRAGTSALIYVVAYLSASVPSVVLGVVSTFFGLTAATVVFASTAALFAALAVVSTYLHR
ncbi:Predicted arabinose efflux permease, MFS family [Saccharopolyspora kobensis]|uniref:Predicted arabinose efflux permease, MFS family n=1 Tax=Saccharopolyspora kobensis TaxID=146035 RepID=A0A1H6E2L1_9PSEU|nr:MFS transporter [Saccharopolyspora kobensis]SEG91423.1 Predicted arabinose efflux permease, MFS family [Saccharopolyspora kobensis]SFF15441.1 Predicted arabinose efflux permease, MFS family [Saccharopolyspora kobensis]